MLCREYYNMSLCSSCFVSTTQWLYCLPSLYLSAWKLSWKTGATGQWESPQSHAFLLRLYIPILPARTGDLKNSKTLCGSQTPGAFPSLRTHTHCTHVCKHSTTLLPYRKVIKHNFHVQRLCMERYRMTPGQLFRIRCIVWTYVVRRGLWEWQFHHVLCQVESKDLSQKWVCNSLWYVTLMGCFGGQMVADFIVCRPSQHSRTNW